MGHERQGEGGWVGGWVAMSYTRNREVMLNRSITTTLESSIPFTDAAGVTCFGDAPFLLDPFFPSLPSSFPFPSPPGVEGGWSLVSLKFTEEEGRGAPIEPYRSPNTLPTFY